MNLYLFAELKRLALNRSRNRQDAIVRLGDVLALRRELVGARDEVGRELNRLRQALDATRAYGRVRKVGRNET